MKTIILVFVCLFATFSYIQAECDEKSSKNVPYNCGKHGEPHFYEENDECHYTCMDNGVKKSCPHAHIVKHQEKYIRSLCRQQTFDCDGKGEDHLEEHDGHCSFGCKSGDIILTCEQVHSYH